MQIPLRTSSTVEAYIAAQEWRRAILPKCPMHSCGPCSLSRHGSYARTSPQGLRIARWYCPEGHRTFSLLPDFVAAGMSGLLACIEGTAAAVKSAASMEIAADGLRGFDVTLPSAVRWLRRRVTAVQAGRDALLQQTVMLSLPPSWVEPDSGHLLLELRRSLTPGILRAVHALGPAPIEVCRPLAR